MPVLAKNSQQLLFVHIPKCAGTEVESRLLPHCDSVLLFSKAKARGVPCDAQHFHSELLSWVIPDVASMKSFAVVRHPLSRIVSEHVYRNRLRRNRGAKPMAFSNDVRHYFFEYRFDRHIYDNHIRPQVEFLLPTTRLFKLEAGVHLAVDYACSVLEIDRPNKSEHGKRENSSDYEDCVIIGKDIRRIQAFYAADFDLLDYETINIGQRETVSLLDLKDKLQAQSVTDCAVTEEGLLSYRQAAGLQTSPWVDRVAAGFRFLAKQLLRPIYR